jgi:two-component system LytT family response regulator
MKKIRIVIADDEENSIEVIKTKLSKISVPTEIVGTANSISQTRYLLANADFDIALLDIIMPGGNTIDLLSKIKNRQFEVVFITAHSDFALNAIKLSAMEYLLKPISTIDLEKVISDFSSKQYLNSAVDNINLLNDNLSAKSILDMKLMISDNKSISMKPLRDLIFIAASRNYSIIRTSSGDEITVSKTLKYFEQKLTDFGFVRASKSHLININHVLKIKRGLKAIIVLSDESEVVLSNEFRPAFFNYLSNSSEFGIIN